MKSQEAGDTYNERQFSLFPNQQTHSMCCPRRRLARHSMRPMEMSELALPILSCVCGRCNMFLEPNVSFTSRTWLKTQATSQKWKKKLWNIRTVAANTSCLLALVKIEQDAENKRVNARTVRICALPFSGISDALVGWILNRMRTGTRSKAVAITVKTTRRKTSIRVGERRSISSEPVIIFCSGERKITCESGQLWQCL